MMTNHVVSELTVDPPSLPAADESHALALAREKALEVTTDRRLMLTAFAQECERYCLRLFWPGEGSATRRYVSVQEVDDPSRPLSIAPDHPDLSGVETSNLTVEVWRSGAFEAADYELRPSGRVRLALPGSYRIGVSLAPPTPAPYGAREGVARLFGLRETKRSGDADIGLPQFGNALLRSGAAEIMRPLRRQLSV